MAITANSARAYYGMQGASNPTKTQVSGSIAIGVASTPLTLSTATIAYCVSGTLASNADTLTIDVDTGIATVGTAPVSQVETATVVAASGATSSGNLAVTVTASRVTGSPLAFSVALVNGVDTTASLIAAKIRTAFNANTALTAVYTVGGTGANITLTEISAENNDSTLNIAITAGLGVSAITSSTNTTAGVGGVKLTNNTGDGKDFEGVSLGAVGAYLGVLIKNTGAVGSASSFTVDWGSWSGMILNAGAVTLLAGNSGIDGYGDMVITHDGGSGSASVEVTFIAEPA